MTNEAPTTPPPDRLDRLSFLSPDRARADQRFRPVAKSSMERRLAEHRAEFAEHEGWLAATKVPGEESRSIGVRDVTHVYSKIEVRGDVERIDAREGTEVIRISPDRALVLCSYVGGAEVRWTLAEHFDAVLDLTGALAALEIEGPGAETVMRRITAHDLDDLPAAAPVAHVGPCVITRDDGARFRIFFPQEYGHYLWEVAVDAAEPLGGGPKA